MSEPHGPTDPQAPPSVLPAGGEAPPPYVIPVRYPPPPPPRPPAAGLVTWLFRSALLFALAVSLGFNFISFCLNPAALSEVGDAAALPEKLYSGKSSARDKIAVVKMDGVIMEGMLNYVHKQIDQAAGDDSVKAVVLRINSPGGSVTASDDLHRRLQELIDGKNPHSHNNKKPLIVSMGAMAASGGYYIAAPASKILAEKTTITGSIGVYAAFPNLSDEAKKYTLTMNIVKQGDLKASGSMFTKMSPQEHQLWQDMVDHAYNRFVEVVEGGRPQLKDKMRRDHKVVDRKIPDGEGKDVDYVRYLADGGIYTSDDALKYQLIDQVGYLDDAVQVAKAQAGLNEFKVITYEKQPTLSSVLFGNSADSKAPSLDPASLASCATPRLWYLTPQAELAGLLAALKHE